MGHGGSATLFLLFVVLLALTIAEYESYLPSSMLGDLTVTGLSVFCALAFIAGVGVYVYEDSTEIRYTRFRRKRGWE